MTADADPRQGRLCCFCCPKQRAELPPLTPGRVRGLLGRRARFRGGSSVASVFQLKTEAATELPPWATEHSSCCQIAATAKCASRPGGTRTFPVVRRRFGALLGAAKTLTLPPLAECRPKHLLGMLMPGQLTGQGCMGSQADTNTSYCWVIVSGI